MAIASITEEQIKYVKKELNFDDSQLETKLEQIKEWLKKQPHLPEIQDHDIEHLIRTYLVGCKLSTEKVKHKIDIYYSMRHQLREIFTDRDPAQKIIRDSVDNLRYCVLPELTPDCIRVNIVQCNPDKDKRFTPQDIIGLYNRLLAVSDARGMQGEFWLGDYLVIDLIGFYFSHVPELPLSLMQRFITFLQEGLPLRLKGVLLINSASYVETTVNVLKPAFKEKIRKRIQIISGDHTNLYKYIPRRILPSNYGGEAPSLEELSWSWQETIETMRDFLIEDGKRKSDESKRPADSVNDFNQVFGVEGTFNKLNID